VEAATVERKYGALRVISTILRVLAWIVLVVGVILVLVGAFTSSPVPTPDVPGGLSVGGPSVFGVILSLVGVGLWSLWLFASAEIIRLFIDLEENTRRTALGRP
jgi:hypothetical protein